MKVKTLAAGILLAVTFGAAAQPMEIPPGKWWKKPRVVDTLKLSTEQQERLEKIFAKNRREFIDLRANVERRQLDFEELIAKKDSDPKKVAAAAEALEEAKHRLGKTRTMMIVEMREVLHEDQWQRLMQGVEQWRSERRERLMERRRGPGGRPESREPAPPEE